MSKLCYFRVLDEKHTPSAQLYGPSIADAATNSASLLEYFTQADLSNYNNVIVEVEIKLTNSQIQTPIVLDTNHDDLILVPGPFRMVSFLKQASEAIQLVLQLQHFQRMGQKSTISVQKLVMQTFQQVHFLSLSTKLQFTSVGVCF